MAAFPSTPHGAGPATGEIGPAVINVRRPRLGASEAPVSSEFTFPGADETLPPTVLRLPNLAALPGPTSTVNKVLSILHWCFIGLGSLIALWLIFGGRGGPQPTGDETPAAPARAQVDASPAWNPPALDTAGDSDAPKWTPPAASAAAAAAPAAPPNMNITPPAATPAAASEAAAVSTAVESATTESATTAPIDAFAPAAESVAPAAESGQPSHESWPQGGAAAPPQSPAGPSVPEMPASAPPESPAAPAWQGASGAPVGAMAGPVARTAARETPAASAPGGEAHPLDLTVPVPQ